MEDKIIEETDKFIKQIMEQGIGENNNLEYLNKLMETKKDAYKIKCIKEEKEMYGNYGRGRRPGYDSYGRNYGEYGAESYGRRGRDRKYYGDDEFDRMAGEYGRYQENRERYGASEETDKSFYFMVEAYKDFTKVLFENAETPQQKQMLREAIQESMM